MQIISWIIGTLLQWYIWIPIVDNPDVFAWRNYRKIEDFTPVESDAFWFWKSHAPTTSKSLPPNSYSLHCTEFFATIKNCDYLADTKNISALKSPQSMGKFAFTFGCQKPCKVLSKDRFILNIQPSNSPSRRRLYRARARPRSCLLDRIDINHRRIPSNSHLPKLRSRPAGGHYGHVGEIGNHR